MAPEVSNRHLLSSSFQIRTFYIILLAQVLNIFASIYNICSDAMTITFEVTLKLHSYMHESFLPIEIVYKIRWAKLRNKRATTSLTHKWTVSKTNKHFNSFLQINIRNSTWSTTLLGWNAAKISLSNSVIYQWSLVEFTSAWEICLYLESFKSSMAL